MCTRSLNRTMSSDTQQLPQYSLIPMRHHTPDGWVTAGGDPDTSKVVGVDLVVDELPAPVLVHVNATCLSMVYFAVHYCRVSTSLHLKPSNPVVVDVARVKVPLQHQQQQKLALDQHYSSTSIGRTHL